MFTVDFYSAVSSVITIPLCFLFVAILTFEWRFPARTMRTLISVFIIFLTAVGLAWFAVCGVNKTTKLYFAVFETLSIIVVNIFISKKPVIHLLSTGTTAWIFALISDAVCGTIVPEAGLAHVLVKVASFLVIAFFLLFFFRRPLLEVQRGVQREKWLWMMIVPLVMCVTFFYVVQMQGPVYENTAFRPVVLALCFYAVSVYVFFYFTLRSLHRQYQMQSEAAVMQVHLSSLKKHAETMKTMSDQLHIIRHDLRHYVHIQTVCLENRDLDGMREALASASKYIQNPGTGHMLCQYTGHSLIDAVLSYYADCAETEGIAFKAGLHLPAELGDISELAVLLSNAVENAYHACCAMDPGSAREIKITGGVKGQQLFLEIGNTYCGEVHFDERGYPVAQQEGHGYGTQSIAAYAEKSGAVLDYEAEDGWFRLRFLTALS